MATVPLVQTFDDEDFLTGLIIYQVGEGGPLGRPITRIELLSPSNKPGGSYHGRYMYKRNETLQSGLRMIEIDYLHETDPLVEMLPSYPKNEEDAYPFIILVSDPRPTLKQGTTQIYGFSVNDPIPVIIVPLAGADSMPFDLGEVYNYTYSRSRYAEIIVDYEQEPVHFERYTPADQQTIRQQMKVIQESSN